MRTRVPVALTLSLVLLFGACTGDDGSAWVMPVGSGVPAVSRLTSPASVAPTTPPTATPSTATPARPGGAGGPTPPAKPRPKQTIPVGAAGLPVKRTTGVRAVALTFDDGPHATYTPQVLDALRAAGVKATFCVVGVKARQYPALVARIVREGHSLCNHSWSHDLDLALRSPEKIRADLSRTNAAIRRAVPGAAIPYFRQPGGRWTAPELTVVKELGMTPLHWTVDPQDWRKPGAPAIINGLERRTRPGAVILLHDGGGDRSGTVGACPKVIPRLKQRYGVVRLG
ncbi:polysaccharide deacetylase family protein [Plantactinospora sp. GCM10030261]|uniref:polysaccharide deacetylase family protein n=1 Tax=Plantactinospora sp. GCM10030261 TaxID=3273420 RepID=UPI003615BEAC